VKSRKRSKELSTQNEKLLYFSAKGYDYKIISISAEKNSCQLRNLTLDKLVRFETRDDSLGDVRWFPLDDINKYR
jgi:hypothetical protein